MLDSSKNSRGYTQPWTSRNEDPHFPSLSAHSPPLHGDAVFPPDDARRPVADEPIKNHDELQREEEDQGGNSNEVQKKIDGKTRVSQDQH